MDIKGLAKLRNHFYRWGLKGGLGILDQVAFSGANFMLGIILARWLSADQFGAYVIAFAVLMVVYQFYVSFLLDPISVLGPAHFPDTLKEYVMIHLKSHFIVTTAAGLFFIVIALIGIGDQSLVRPTLFAMGGTLPLLLLPWYLRRVFYILGQPHVSLLGSLVYTAVLVVLVIFLHQIDSLSSPSAILVTAIAGLFSGLFLLLVFPLRKSHGRIMSFTAGMMQNWKFGKWLIISSIFIAFASQVPIWISASFLGLSASGTLRALQVIIQPMMLTITALTALATPALSFEFSKGNFRGFNRKVLLLSSSLLILAIVFEVFLLLFSIPIERLVYGGKFSTYTFLLPIWGIIPLILAFSSGLQAGIQAAQKPHTLLVAAILWATASFGFGIWLTYSFGVLGATWSAIFGYLIFVFILSILYWIWVYRPFRSSGIEPV